MIKLKYTTYVKILVIIVIKILPSDSCKAELNAYGAPSIRSTVAYQYCLLCLPLPWVQDRRTAQRLERGRGGKRAGNSCYGQKGNKNVQLVLHCCKTSWKAVLPILPSRNQTCLATYQFAWILTSGWIKLRGTHVMQGVTSLAAKQVCLGPVKRPTCTHCCKTRSHYLLFCNNFSELAMTSFVTRQVWFLGGNTRNNSLCNNVAKQVARFCCLFHHIFTTEITTMLAINNNNNNNN